jgi:hypothetical protein
MNIKMSLAAASLLAGTVLLADSTTITDALKNGTFGADLSLYGEYSDIKHIDNQGFGSGSFNMFFSTDAFYGVTVSAGSRANHAFWEIDGGEYIQADKAVLHTANVAYTHKYFDAILGRQEINLNWVSDFHEALVGVLKIVPDTTIIAGYTQRKATADFDSPLVPFDKLGEDGALVVDATWSGRGVVEGLKVNPFVYYVHHLSTWAGAKVDYDKKFTDFAVGGTIQYTQSDEDGNRKDNSFLQLEARGSFIGIGAKLGYFKADKDGGANTIIAAGENVNPFEDGDYIFEVDANTFYLGATYDFQDFAFSALYGYTKYDADGKFNELDLGVGYKLSDNLALQGFLINGDGNQNDDYIKVTLGATYTF